VFKPKPLVLIPGSKEWVVVHQAMDQFVANHGEYAELVADDSGDETEIAKVTATQETAEAVLEKFTAVFCALADSAT